MNGGNSESMIVAPLNYAPDFFNYNKVNRSRRDQE